MKNTSSQEHKMKMPEEYSRERALVRASERMENLISAA